MPGALNMIEALRSAVKGLASGIGDYYRRDAGMDTTPVSSLSPEELSLLRDNSELFYRLYPTAPSVDFDKLNSSVTTNTPQASTAIQSGTSSEQGASDTVIKPPVQPPTTNVWEETFSKAREERQQPVVPNEIELGVTQGIINSYFRKGGDYNTAALLYKRDTGMDFNSLVNHRNNLQKALGISIGVKKLNPRPVSQSSQPVVQRSEQSSGNTSAQTTVGSGWTLPSGAIDSVHGFRSPAMKFSASTLNSVLSPQEKTSYNDLLSRYLSGDGEAASTINSILSDVISSKRVSSPYINIMNGVPAKRKYAWG